MELPRAIMVSLQKSGTHLVSGLAEEIGYQVSGWVVAKPPVFPKSEDDRIMAAVFSEEEYKAIQEMDEERKAEKMRHAYTSLFISWSLRTGVPNDFRHYMGVRYSLSKVTDISRLMSLDYSSMPAQHFWVKHELPLRECDGKFIKEWNYTGEPRIIFNYRDPRDIMISFINYLTGKTKVGRFSDFTDYITYSKILLALPDMETRLMHAILDPNFPGHQDLEQHLWMLKHPMVCKVSFEELVGARGGGCDQKRTEAVARILKHVDCDRDAEEVGTKLFKTDTLTFNKGQIGVWRDIFTDDHHRAFNARFGAITRAYGFEIHEPA